MLLGRRVNHGRVPLITSPPSCFILNVHYLLWKPNFRSRFSPSDPLFNVCFTRYDCIHTYGFEFNENKLVWGALGIAYTRPQNTTAMYIRPRIPETATKCVRDTSEQNPEERMTPLDARGRRAVQKCQYFSSLPTYWFLHWFWLASLVRGGNVPMLVYRSVFFRPLHELPWWVVALLSVL